MCMSKGRGGGGSREEERVAGAMALVPRGKKKSNEWSNEPTFQRECAMLLLTSAAVGPPCVVLVTSTLILIVRGKVAVPVRLGAVL